MHQERRESKISVLFWPEVSRFEMALGLILVPALGLMGTVDGAASDILGRCPARSRIWEAQHLGAFSRSHLAQRTIRQDDSYETRLPQSKFKVLASMCVSLDAMQRPTCGSMAVQDFTSKSNDPSMCSLLWVFPKALGYIASEAWEGRKGW